MKKIIIHTDGGARGNPGPAAVGVVISVEPAHNAGGKGNIIKKYSQYLGENFTNNEAEYQAVIFALKKVKLLFGKKKAGVLEVEINSDSELLTKQMQGLYKILAPEIQNLFIKVWNLKIDFKEVRFKFVARGDNIEADKLVNEALDSQSINQKLL